MKNLILSIFVILPIIEGNAQETLYANDSHTVALFFPSPIRQAVTGSENFTFSYNREAGQHFGLLQANKGGDSNLLVITRDGRAYSYGLEYRKDLPGTYRFITFAKSIGKETETKKLEKTRHSTLIPKTIEIPQPNPAIQIWEKGAEYVLGRKTKVLKTKRKDGLLLRFKELFYHKNEVYMEMEIHNRSAIDFEVDVLEIYKVNGKKGRRSSHQKVLLEPKFKFGVPEVVQGGQRQSFVFVFQKFTLGDTELLLLNLIEAHGSRNIQLSTN